MQIVLQACTQKRFGFIYDIDTQKALQNVTVNDPYNNITVVTDEEGKFILHKGIVKYLVFQKKGYITDTVKSFIRQGPERRPIKNFKGNKIYLVSKGSKYLNYTTDSIKKNNF